MIRRFNYTDRIRIRRSDVHITVGEGDSATSFDASLHLKHYALPPEAQVFLEAYRQTVWMRFPYGTVGNVVQPSSRDLREFGSPEGVQFRVKVAQAGNIHKLIAEADGIPLLLPDENQGQREPLLPVVPRPIGNEIFRLDYSDDSVVLLINSEVGNYNAMTNSPEFHALVYPAVFREILTRAISEEVDEDDDKRGWQAKWLVFAKSFPGLGDLPARDEIDDRATWVTRAVDSFCKRIGAKRRFAEFWMEAT